MKQENSFGKCELDYSIDPDINPLCKIWTQNQKQQLIKAYEIFGNDWLKISEKVSGRSSQACHTMGLKLNIVSKEKKDFKNIKQYSTQQDQMILQLYKTLPEKWDKIAEKMNGRSPQAIYCRYRTIHKLNFHGIRRDWNNEEDQLLLQLVRILDFNWTSISKVFENCTGNHCYSRYKCLIGLNQRGIWQLSEDNKLLELFEKYDGDWNLVQKQFNFKRKARSCKERFNKLKKKNLKKKWTLIDFNKLVEYHQNNLSWDQIQKKLPLFTVRECYFKYYHHYLREKYAEERQKINYC